MFRIEGYPRCVWADMRLWVTEGLVGREEPLISNFCPRDQWGSYNKLEGKGGSKFVRSRSHAQSNMIDLHFGGNLSGPSKMVFLRWPSMLLDQRPMDRDLSKLGRGRLDTYKYYCEGLDFN